MIKISVIIPVYNRLADLKRCLASINAQADQRTEVLVIDDHSDDPVSYACTCGERYVRNETRLGPSYSRNLAACRAKGNILLFLDSDVELMPHTLKAIEQILDNHNEIACVGGSGPLDASGRDVAYIKTKYYSQSGCNRSIPRTVEDFTNHDPITCDHFESACMAIRRPAFEQIGGFDPFWFYMGEDRELCLRLRRSGYGVAVSWRTRAIHHEKDLRKKQSLSFRRFLSKRYLEVAFKHDGCFGAIRWLATNYDQFRMLIPLQPIQTTIRMRELIRRRGINFLRIENMALYEEMINGQRRSQDLSR